MNFKCPFLSPRDVSYGAEYLKREVPFMIFPGTSPTSSNISLIQLSFNVITLELYFSPFPNLFIILCIFLFLASAATVGITNKIRRKQLF